MIEFDDFLRVDMRVGRILAADPFPEARKPSYRLRIDFGPELGIRRTSAQVTALYRPEELVGRQVVCVVNFPPKQIGPMMSQFLLTGFHREDGAIVLAVPERAVPNGAKLV